MTQTGIPNNGPDNEGIFKPGSLIDGKWILIEQIGKGGMGEVYKAHQLNLKRDVAIKVISAEFLKDMEEDPEELDVAIGRFQREVQTMARVRHPNILQIYDYGTLPPDQGEPGKTQEYIAMEYVPGNTFRFTMSEEGFDTEETLLSEWLRRYFLPVLDGVDAIHASGIIHRDIKPENILMDAETPKIADFGLARSYQMQAVSNSLDIKGTMIYMAPEQFEDFRKAGVEADIYALGKILYEAVEGKLSPNTVPFKSVGLEAPETPLLRAIDAIIRKATHEDKTLRFSSVSEMRAEMLKAFQRHEQTDNRDSAPDPHSKGLWIGIAVTLLSILGMTGYHVYHWLVPDKSFEALKDNHPFIEANITGTPDKEYIAGDGRTMTLIPSGQGNSLFYADPSPVTFHHYTEFLNRVADQVTVTEGLVKKKDEIWYYLGSGSEPNEQILFEHSRFHLRDVAWAGRPVVRVTWFGAMAYARFYGKTLPDYFQWRGTTSLLGPSGITLPVNSPDKDNQPDIHATMMGTAGDTNSTPDSETTVKEWIDYSSSTEADEIKSPHDVRSHVVNPSDTGMLSGQKQPLLRYPWEGFPDVGFRTVIPLQPVSP